MTPIQAIVARAIEGWQATIVFEDGNGVLHELEPPLRATHKGANDDIMFYAPELFDERYDCPPVLSVAPEHQPRPLVANEKSPTP